MENQSRTLIIVLIVVLVLLLFGNFGYGMGGFGGMMGGFYGGFMLLGWIINIFIIILIILGIYWLVRHIGYDGKGMTYNGRRIK